MLLTSLGDDLVPNRTFTHFLLTSLWDDCWYQMGLYLLLMTSLRNRMGPVPFSYPPVGQENQGERCEGQRMFRWAGEPASGPFESRIFFCAENVPRPAPAIL